MQRVTFVNSRGESLVFGNSPPFILNKIEGVDGPPGDILSTKSPYQDGSSFDSIRLSERPITITGYIIPKTMQEMYQQRRNIMRILNPKLGLGRLVYSNDAQSYAIDAVIEGSPTFQERYTHNQSFVLNFICPDPYFTDENKTSKGLRFESGGMTFPLRLPTMFAYSAYRGNFTNSGDVETPVEIHYKGPALNPIITNETTGEFIKVNYDLSENDVLVINTAFGQKRVEVMNSDGSRTNVFHWIDLDSTFFQLDIGQNILRYDSDREGDRSVATVTVYWYNRYIGG